MVLTSLKFPLTAYCCCWLAIGARLNESNIDSNGDQGKWHGNKFDFCWFFYHSSVSLIELITYASKHWWSTLNKAGILSLASRIINPTWIVLNALYAIHRWSSSRKSIGSTNPVDRYLVCGESIHARSPYQRRWNRVRISRRSYLKAFVWLNMYMCISFLPLINYDNTLTKRTIAINPVRQTKSKGNRCCSVMRSLKRVIQRMHQILACHCVVNCLISRFASSCLLPLLTGDPRNHSNILRHERFAANSASY